MFLWDKLQKKNKDPDPARPDMGDGKKRISIFGVCISRDIITASERSDLEVARFIQDVPPVSATGMPALDMDYDELIDKYLADSPTNHFYKRCFALGVTGRAFEYLFGAPADYLMLDLGNCRFNLLGSGNIYIADTHADLREKLCANYGNVLPIKRINDDNEVSRLNVECLRKYLDEILRHYDRQHIILVDIAAVEGYVDENGSLMRFNEEAVKHYNKRIRNAYNFAVEYLDGCHVIEFPDYMLGTCRHKWGKSPLHYDGMYYEYANKALDVIMLGMPLHEERMRLASLRRDYCEKAQSLFYNALDKSFETSSIAQDKFMKCMQYLFTGRVDVKNVNADVKTSDLALLVLNPQDNVSISTPAWYKTGGTGYVVTGTDGKISFSAEMKNSGELEILLRSTCIRRKQDNHTICIYLDYTSFVVNGKQLIDAPICLYHDKPFVYKTPVKEGDAVKVDISWRMHQWDNASMRDVMNQLFDNYK